MKKGFTLIELLIVITIIGILAVVFLPTVLNAPAKARDAARQADVANIIKGIEAGRLSGTSLPTDSGCVEAVLTDFAGNMPNGMIPRDPKSDNTAVGTCPNDNADGNASYTYEYYGSGPMKYGIFATTETNIGNIDCGDVEGGLAVGSPTLVTTKDQGCYGGMSQ